MNKLLTLGAVALVSFSLTGTAFGKNIKVVCQSDPKHDKAKLIKALKTREKGDKIVVFGTCLPKGIQDSASHAYQPERTGVVILIPTKSQPYST